MVYRANVHATRGATTAIHRFPGVSQKQGRGLNTPANNEIKLCSIHNKMRGLSSLEKDGFGGFACASGMECKLSPIDGSVPHLPKGTVPECGTATCNTHNKNRALTCLEENGKGGYRCVAPFQCKGAAASKQGQQHSLGMCVFHQKRRGMSVLKKVRGGYRCVSGSECKLAGDSRMHGETNTDELYLCATHHKMRNISCMVDQGNGTYACSPEFECKEKTTAPLSAGIPAHKLICSVHNKMRSAECLEENAAGVISCSTGNECKGGPKK